VLDAIYPGLRFAEEHLRAILILTGTPPRIGAADSASPNVGPYLHLPGSAGRDTLNAFMGGSQTSIGSVPLSLLQPY